MRRQVAIGAAAVVVVVAVVLAAVAVVTSRSRDAEGDPVAALLVAYERSRNATYVLRGNFSRTMPDGRRLESAVLEVQRPPDRLHRRLGSTAGRIDGRWLNCSTDPDGSLECAPGGVAPPWEESVAAEVATLRSYFEGDPPPYSVQRSGDGCFELMRADWYPQPPQGVPSQMCFDPATGALHRLAIAHEGGTVEVIEAVTLRTEVSDADFRLADDPAYGFPGEPGPSGVGAGS
jgi:hypothetical protein